MQDQSYKVGSFPLTPGIAQQCLMKPHAISGDPILNVRLELVCGRAQSELHFGKGLQRDWGSSCAWRAAATCFSSLSRCSLMIRRTSSSVVVPGQRLAGTRPATLGMLASGDHTECFILLNEQLSPHPQVAKEPVELGVESLRLGDLHMRLLDVLHHVDDLAEHLIEGVGRIVGWGRAHVGKEPGRRPWKLEGRTTESHRPLLTGRSFSDIWFLSTIDAVGSIPITERQVLVRGAYRCSGATPTFVGHPDRHPVELPLLLHAHAGEESEWCNGPQQGIRGFILRWEDA